MVGHGVSELVDLARHHFNSLLVVKCPEVDTQSTGGVTTSRYNKVLAPLRAATPFVFPPLEVCDGRPCRLGLVIVVLDLFVGEIVPDVVD